MNMISVQEAKQLISDSIFPMTATPRILEDAAGLVLAEEVYAPIDLPPFPQAGMDGYAFAYQKDIPSYTLIGEVAAGSDVSIELLPGQAVRIFTGAPVPDGANTVVMQERVRVEENRLYVEDPTLSLGHNFRAKGSDIARGTLAMAAGHTLTPAGIGFLAAMGYAEVPVFPAPRVSIVVTGDELQVPGEALAHGQVYEANSHSLRAALKQVGIQSTFIYSVGDDLTRLQSVIHEALKLTDLVLITGGVSVGKYDYTLDACDRNGVKTVFHKVKQKPGKPLFFGMKGHNPVFGLPGNPSSVLTCFYQYVYPAIGRLINQPLGLAATTARMDQAYKKPEGITHFLRASLEGDLVQVRKGQESYRLQSFMAADAFIVLPETCTEVQSGEEVIVEKIPV
jgi:molybdopterin molybdotransferase